MKILVTGASGFIGSRLTTALTEHGHDVLAMTRHPDAYSGAGTVVRGDVGDPDSLAEALNDVDAAYYLVHSLESKDFADKDAQAAHNFTAAAQEAGLQRVVYLGGLGSDADDLSPHLRSRRQVEHILSSGSVPVTVLRAAVVVGHGGISWEITRQLVAHLPIMVAPKWTNTRTQPIALADVLRYLVGVLDHPESAGKTYEIGGPEVLRYLDMLKQAAEVMYSRSLPVLPVPLLSPRLSSGWLALVTDVDLQTARTLVDSMTNEVIVNDDSIRDLLPFAPMKYQDAVRAALDERAASTGRERPEAEPTAEPAQKERT